MKIENVIRFIGLTLLLNSAMLLISLIIAIVHNDSGIMPIVFSMFLCILLGLFPMIFVKRPGSMNIQEGVLSVVFGWLITCITGMLPYLLWGGEFSLVNAWFESVSGYTTTGSTILTDVEILPKSLLFWRSSTHFIGGIGIIMLSLLLIPDSGTTKLVLFNRELSDLAKTSFKFRVKMTVRILVMVYIGLILLETLALVIAGMSLFDAVNHSFATVATGGFSTKNLSIAYYDNYWIEIIIMIFMVLSSLNFGLLFVVFTKKVVNIFRTSIARWYLIFLSIGVLLITVKLFLSGYGNFWDSLRYGSFQLISVGTTTGFATADTVTWPLFAQMIMIFFMIQCGCAGSTSGGLKFDRVFVFYKSIRKQIRMLHHPRAIVTIKIDNNTLSEQLENSTLAFIVFYVFIILISTLLLSALDIDLMTAFSGSVATMGNVGPGFSTIGSMGNYNQIPDIAKIIFSVDMFLGRLEIYSILSVIFIKSWK